MYVTACMSQHVCGGKKSLEKKLQFYSTVLQHYNFLFGEVLEPTYMLGSYMETCTHPRELTAMTHQEVLTTHPSSLDVLTPTHSSSLKVLTPHDTSPKVMTPTHDHSIKVLTTTLTLTESLA